VFIPCPYSIGTARTLKEFLHSSDWLLFSGSDDLLDKIVSPSHEEHCQIIRFPELYFDAFHPDQVYAWAKKGSLIESATGPYNSAIALWAWRRGLSVEKTLGLFDPLVFEALGYHSRWQVSVNRLERDYSKFPLLDYRDFLNPLQHNGCFMHTVNHPKIFTIVQVARVLAKLIDPAIETDYVPAEEMVEDALFSVSLAWSVYPSVANTLGLEGAYLFKKEDHRVLGLGEFLTESFSRYENQRIHDADCHELDRPIYDEVLGATMRKGI
jgi:hypothetical protein